MKSDIKENKDNLAIPKLDLSFNITKNNKKKNKSYVDNGTSFIINDISKISQNLKANKPKENKESVNKPKINYTLLNRSKLIQNMKMKKKLNETKNNSNKMDL